MTLSFNYSSLLVVGEKLASIISKNEVRLKVMRDFRPPLAGASDKKLDRKRFYQRKNFRRNTLAGT